jgi:hypothetical protein
MQGIYYLLSLIALGVVIRWVVINDRLQPGEPTKGLLRMKDPLPQSGAAPAPSRPNGKV